MPVVRVVLGDNEVSRYSFDRDVVTIGRSRDCHIVVENLAVSRTHAQIERQDNDIYILTDLSSANGTSVNGVQITNIEIMHGDEIKIGKHQLFFEDDQRAEVAIVSDAFKGDRTMLVEKTPEAKLTIVKGKQKGTDFTVANYETIIGRGPDCDVRVTDWFVSREHAAIVRQGQNFFIKDKGSWKGVLVNGKKTVDDILQSGDVIKIGSTEIRFDCESGAEAADEEMPPKISDMIGQPIEEDALWMTGQIDLTAKSGDGDDDSPRIEMAADLKSRAAGAALEEFEVIAPSQPPLSDEELVAAVDDEDDDVEEPPADEDDVNVEPDKLPDKAGGTAIGLAMPKDSPFSPDELAAAVADDDEEDADAPKAFDDVVTSEGVTKPGFVAFPSLEPVNATPDSEPPGEATDDIPATESEPREAANEVAAAEMTEKDEVGATEQILDEEDSVPDEADDSDKPPETEEAMDETPPTAPQAPVDEESADGGASEEETRQIKIWERALENSNPVIRREAARNLRKLTGREYDV